MYAILDIETTGLNSATERITEIAIYIHDGEKIVDEFQSLLNPEKRIPFQITGLTGIDNKMVKDSPRFCELARKIIELTENKIIVGHNVAFDYSFIRAEFKRLFYEYKRKTICTRKLARRLMPGRRSYGLGVLCRDIEIKIKNRHRAGGDALATVSLFEYLNTINHEPTLKNVKGFNSNLKSQIIDELPDKTGVYYFLNDKNEPIYIGKSTNIHSRILSHLNNNKTKRAVDLREQAVNITYELTGSELLALLLESYEIKKHKPVFNRSLRRSNFPYGLFDITDKDGYINLMIRKIRKDDLPLTCFNNLKEAREHVSYLVEEHTLCQKLTGLYKTSSTCFNHQIHKCLGACNKLETPELYNKRVQDAIHRYLYEDLNFYIIDSGRTPSERSVVKVSNGRYIGFGYIDINDMKYAENIMDCIMSYPDNKDSQVIIKGYLRRHKPSVTILKIEQDAGGFNEVRGISA